MRYDGSDNRKKLREFFSIVFPSKNKNENKNSLNGYSDFVKSLLVIRSNKDKKNNYNDKSK